MNELPKYTLGQTVIVGTGVDRQMGKVTAARIDSDKWAYAIDLGEGHGMPLAPEAAVSAFLKLDGTWVSTLGDVSTGAYQL